MPMYVLLLERRVGGGGGLLERGGYQGQGLSKKQVLPGSAPPPPLATGLRKEMKTQSYKPTL